MFKRIAFRKIIIIGGFIVFLCIMLNTMWFQRSREISMKLPLLHNQELTEQWQEIAAKLDVDTHAKMVDFELFYRPNGDILNVSYEMVGRSKDDNIYYYVDYNGQEQKVKVKKHKLDSPWKDYDHTIEVRYLFDRLSNMDVTLLKPDQDDPVRKLQLNESGIRVNYAMKDIKKYRIDLKGLREINDSQLPVQGYWMLVCGISEDAVPDYATSCEGRIDYFLDARTADEGVGK